MDATATDNAVVVVAVNVDTVLYSTLYWLTAMPPMRVGGLINTRNAVPCNKDNSTESGGLGGRFTGTAYNGVVVSQLRLSGGVCV